MASVHADIRNALEAQVANIAGVPTPVGSANSFEGVEFEPTQGTSWLRVRVYPLSRRPLDVTADGLQRYDGTLLIQVHTPFGYGAGAGETLADAVVAAYEAGSVFTSNGTNVQIEYAEVNNSPQSDPPWVITPVLIKWKSFSN